MAGRRWVRVGQVGGACDDVVGGGGGLGEVGKEIEVGAEVGAVGGMGVVIVSGHGGGLGCGMWDTPW